MLCYQITHRRCGIYVKTLRLWNWDSARKARSFWCDITLKSRLSLHFCKKIRATRTHKHYITRYSLNDWKRHNTTTKSVGTRMRALTIPFVVKWHSRKKHILVWSYDYDKLSFYFRITEGRDIRIQFLAQYPQYCPHNVERHANRQLVQLFRLWYGATGKALPRSHWDCRNSKVPYLHNFRYGNQKYRMSSLRCALLQCLS